MGGVSVLKRVVKIILALLILPYLLILIYSIPQVRPISTLMVWDLLSFQGYDRRWVSIDDISPNLIRAVMMSEDGQFCSHHGVDIKELKAVLDNAVDGSPSRGASTIPMQTAKNLFLWNGRSFVRKALELPLAITSDFLWSKSRMMEIYLNIAEWGPNIYGIEAAAQHHFKVPASKLTQRQASLLAVSLPNPIERSASKPGRGLQRLANLNERRARASGAYTQCVISKN